MINKMPLMYLRNLIGLKTINKTFNRDLSTKIHYDIIIAGGGMVGTTLACTLGNKKQLDDKKILLLESSKEFKWECTEKYSNRVVALTPATRKLLQSIEAWDIIEKTRYGSVKKMQVWDALSDAMITFENDHLNENIAYIVENDLLLSAVTKLIKNHKNINLINNARIKDYILPQRVQNNVEVIMEDGTTYTCNLLLGADGANSKVRAKMGIQLLNWNYHQMGVVATLNLSEADENVVAWQRFLPNGNGPVALLPLNNKQSSLVWTTKTDFGKKLLTLSDNEFVDELNTALWKSYKNNDIVNTVTKNLNTLLENLNLTSNAVRQLPPSIKSIEPKSRAAFPLGFGHATNYVAKGVALVGDAAHRVHPLAGQGVNLGFGDVACIADLLAEAVYSGRNMGSVIHLHEYEKLRQRYNFPTMVAIDGLQKLYGTDLTPVVLLRTMGLQITHAMNPIKKMIMGHASGWKFGNLL